MTDKFKKRVREHAKKQGMSYQAALQQLETVHIPRKRFEEGLVLFTAPDATPEDVEILREVIRRELGLDAERVGAVVTNFSVEVTELDGAKMHELGWVRADGSDRKALADEVEQLHVQLAGCSVAAFGHGKGNHDAKPGDYGHSVAYEDVKGLRQRHEAAMGLIGALWQLIDDIDTAGDWAKGDDGAYRRAVEGIQKLRWETGVVSDGYRIYLRDWPEKRPPASWLDKYDPTHVQWGPGVLDGIGPEIFAGAPESSPEPSDPVVCPECGPVTKCDEDGCCVMCGEDLFNDEDGNPRND